jgi:ubiquinone/menaquinone biosynthesis C-methylase UbiE
MGAHAKHPLRTLGSFSVALLFALLAQLIGAHAQQQRDSREEWFRLPDIFQALGLRDGSRVADVGAGPGFFTVQMARIVGETGRVFAVDIDESALTALRQRIREETLNNIDVIQGDPRDPKLALDSLDAALIVDAYHEMAEHGAMLTGIRRALKPQGRLVIIDRMPRITRDKPRKDQVEKHAITSDFVQAELSEAGFEIVDRRDDFISRPQNDDYFWLIIARRPGRP